VINGLTGEDWGAQEVALRSPLVPWGTVLEDSALKDDDSEEIGRGLRRAVSVISLSAFAGREYGRLKGRAVERLKCNCGVMSIGEMVVVLVDGGDIDAD